MPIDSAFVKRIHAQGRFGGEGFGKAPIGSGARGDAVLGVHLRLRFLAHMAATHLRHIA
ncbi:hypothetical protein [Brevundimonas sp. PAMC22021]|uniref:hypothetical protein n=1 Tax=Brevundimonas sp. PAMC22021 TaxID=2861285 RepID=UPI001C62E519|nr:hypothetical protein [Brevundimonas sp. PAMC22021]QYF85767.1 hypothetical protein KY493_07735 [Brevundimonas sp. PAMC22021]